MNNNPQITGQLQFEVDASLLVQLGERLFTRRSIALAELIKNAYDADATTVSIEFQNIKEPKGTIVISDNGSGMTLSDVQKHWMRIATDHKRKKSYSQKYIRPRAGDKGIGRFAVRHLADKLTLDTVAKDNNQKTRTIVEFDWSKEFRDGDTLTTIPVNYVVEEVPGTSNTGTILILESVRSAWKETDISDLQNDLYALVNPFPLDVPLSKDKVVDPGFHFSFVIPEYPEYQGTLDDNFYASAWSVLTGRVDPDGAPNYGLEIRSPNEILEFNPENEDFSLIKNAVFEIHYFNWQAKFFRDTPLGLRKAQQTGRGFGGVRVYLDNFRVFPYGDSSSGDDWLELGQVSAERTRSLVPESADLTEIEASIGGRPILLLPRNNQLFGIVSIQTGNTKLATNLEVSDFNFEITASREGFVENEAYRELRRFVQIGLWWMTLQYARVTEAEREARRQERRQGKRPGTVEILEDAKRRVADDPDIGDVQKQSILALLDSASREAILDLEDRISEMAILRVLSATGTVVSMMNHQLRSMLSGIRAATVDLAELRPYVKDQGYKKYREILDQLEMWREGIRLQVSQLGFLLGPDARSKRKRVVLRRLVDEVVNPLSIYMQKFGIEFINAVPPNVKTPIIFPEELYAVLLHTFTNALKAVRKKPVRRIAVQSQVSSDGLHIYMVDTGSGVPDDMREKVFDLFESTSAPDPIIGTGTGLGLKIVRDTISEYGGFVRFIDPEEPWNTCLEIFLPR